MSVYLSKYKCDVNLGSIRRRSPPPTVHSLSDRNRCAYRRTEPTVESFRSFYSSSFVSSSLRLFFYFLQARVGCVFMRSQHRPCAILSDRMRPAEVALICRQQRVPSRFARPFDEGPVSVSACLTNMKCWAEGKLRGEIGQN